jgi:hypothetical protein
MIDECAGFDPPKSVRAYESGWRYACYTLQNSKEDPNFHIMAYFNGMYSKRNLEEFAAK